MADWKGESTVGSAAVVHVYLLFGVSDDVCGLGQLVEVGDLLEEPAFAAAQTAIRRLGVQPPAATTSRALHDDAHGFLGYLNCVCRLQLVLSVLEAAAC